jgi:ketosteroid isomerase-like protein
MKIRTSALILMAIALSLACTPLIAQSTLSPDDQKQIDELRHGLVRAFNNRDIEGILKYVQPDVVVVWQNAEVNDGQDAVRQFYNKTITSGLVKSVTFNPVVENRVCHDNTCISVGSLNDEFSLKDGSDFPFHSRFTATLVKTNGSWKIASFHASSNAFESPAVKQAAIRSAMYGSLGGLVVGLILGAVFFRRRRA